MLWRRTIKKRRTIFSGFCHYTFLFSLYINDLIKILRSLAIGCHLITLFIACILFADDFSLLAPTRSAMTTMIEACFQYCKRFCLKFNQSIKFISIQHIKWKNNQNVQITVIWIVEEGGLMWKASARPWLGAVTISHGLVTSLKA